MKASDLRIGNFVYDIDYYQIEVRALNLGGVFDDNGTWFDVDFCEPIPLTEEWLLKFGFEFLDLYFNEGIPVKDYGINITKCNTVEKLSVSNWDMNISIGDYYSGEDYVLDRDIKHVHQLQNLYFALTGEELKIKNK